MNVAFDPWIPVVDTAGERTLLSLKDVITEGDRYVDFAVRPHERVSLMRLILCVAHASLDGPKNFDEWCDAPKRMPEAVAMYLEKWKDSFELFHPQNPWLQISKLKGVEKDGKNAGQTSPVALLDFELATGNNSTLGDHSGQLPVRSLSPERLAMVLLTFQNFSSGGGSPIAQWEDIKTSQVGNPDAPCLSQSMAHCLFRGKNLSETIHLNLPAYDTVLRVYKSITVKKKEINYEGVGIGKPVWEDFPTSPDSTSQSVENATRTYLGRLVPISRWIRLIENTDRMYCCNGFKYDTYKDGFPAEPTAAVRLVTIRDNSERKVISIDPVKALWRELSALLIKRTADGLGGPIAMENAPNDSEFDFHVCALTRDQASMDIALESVFHITPTLRTNRLVYQSEVEQAEKVSGRLRRAIEQYRISIDGDWLSRVRRTEAKQQNDLKNKLAQSAFTSYWTTVEKNLSLLVAHIETIGTDEIESSLGAWRKMLARTAHDAYRIACGQDTPRQMKAFTMGYQKLISNTENTNSNNTVRKEEEHELVD